MTVQALREEVDHGRMDVFASDNPAIEFDRVPHQLVKFPTTSLTVDGSNRRVVAYLFGQKPIILSDNFVGLTKEWVKWLCSSPLDKEESSSIISSDIQHSHS